MLSAYAVTFLVQMVMMFSESRMLLINLGWLLMLLTFNTFQYLIHPKTVTEKDCEND